MLPHSIHTAGVHNCATKISPHHSLGMVHSVYYHLPLLHKVVRQEHHGQDPQEGFQAAADPCALVQCELSDHAGVG